jgi:N-methylhydantoinase A
MRELQVKRVVIPKDPAVFSAWGMLMTDLRQDYVRTWITRIDRTAPDRLEAIYAEMENQARADMAAQHVAPEDFACQRFADMRYFGQEHTVKVPLPAGVINAGRIPEIVERFHQLHQHAYTFRLVSPVEVVNYHLTALGRVSKPRLAPVQAKSESLDGAHKGSRRVDFDEFGFCEAEIYERDLLPVGSVLKGPLVIEEPASTTVVFPGQTIRRDEFDFLHIEAATQ